MSGGSQLGRLIPITGPLVMVEEGLCRRSSNPGTFKVPGKGFEVARKCGLQEPPCSIHVVDVHEREGAHHLEPFADITARNNPSIGGKIGYAVMNYTKNSESEYSESNVTPNSAKYYYFVSAIFRVFRQNILSPNSAVTPYSAVTENIQYFRN